MKATLIGKRYYRYEGNAQYAPSERLYLYFSRLPTIADKGETKGEITCQFSINMLQSSAAKDLAQRFINMDPGTRLVLETIKVGDSEQITDFTEIE